MSRKLIWKCEIGQVIKDKKRDMILIDREYRKREHTPDKKGRVYIENEKWYKYHCNIDGNEDWIIENALLTQCAGCNVCSNQKAMLGVNTIWDTDRYLVEVYGLDEQFAKTHTIGCKEKGKFTCKNCVEIKLCLPHNVKQNKSIGCICNDSISYPEKFIYSILKQLNINFKMQISKNNFKWIDKYYYDFYIPELDLILETHGEQHGKFITKGELTLVKKEKTSFNKKNKRNEIKNDADKCWLSYKNGVDRYIQLDCGKSDINYIKNNIFNSELVNIFDLSNIDWNKCNEFALRSNLIKEICEYWNNREEWESTMTISRNNKWGVGYEFIKKALIKGTELNWCYYDVNEELKKGRSKNSGDYAKCMVICLETKEIYNSISEAGKEIGCSCSLISNICQKKKGYYTAKGYHFMYYKEYEKVKDTNYIEELLKPHKISEETKKKLSEANKGKGIKKVICIETNEIFNSITNASEKFKVPIGNITKACKGERKTAGGYHWKYVEEENN